MIIILNTYHINVIQSAIDNLRFVFKYLPPYHLHSGRKCQGGDYNVYATPAATGDTVTMIVDLRPFKGRLSFEKNGRDLDTAYLGLNYWGDIYLMFSIWDVGHMIKVIKYEVTE